MNRKKNIRAIGVLALLLVSLALYGCSPSASPQNNIEVQEFQPESQEEQYQEPIQESAPEAALDAAPQAKLVSPEGQIDPIEEPALAEPGGGIGGGLAAGQASDEPAPAPQPETKPEEPAQQPDASAEESAPAPQLELSASSGEPTIGSLAPEFTLQTLNGQSVQLSALRGKNLLISYWVTWCIPCMEELPLLNQINQEYQSENLVILSVNGIQQDELDKVTATISEMGLTLPVVLDQSEILWDTYWVRFLPTSFFIDEDGVIRHIQLGSLTEEDLRIKIEQLITDQL